MMIMLVHGWARGSIFCKSYKGVSIMKGNELPLQSGLGVRKQSANDACPAFASAGISLQRRRLLQALGVGALGLALPAAGSGVALAADASGEGREPVAAPFWQPAGMDLSTAIFTRRTQREYTGEPVTTQDLQRILAAGMNAPSAHNTQPWSFVVLTSQESLNRIPKLIPYTQYAVKAGAAVLSCVRFLKGEIRELALMSVACCMQNMLLTSHALGYGSVWMQIYPNDDYMKGWRQEAKIPEDVLPLALMPIGKPVSALPPVNRMDSTKIFYETWQNS